MQKRIRGTYPSKRNAYIAHHEPLVFHCHHYNCFLQSVIEDTKDYIDAYSILTDSAHEIVYDHLHAFFVHNQILSPTERIQAAEDFFSFCGFGKFSLDTLSSQGGKVIAKTDHYSMGWNYKFGKRKPNQPPVSFFTCGFLAAATEAIYNHSKGSMECVQTHCLTKGDSIIAFEVKPAPISKKLSRSPQEGVPQENRPVMTTNTGVDYAAIKNALFTMDIKGSESEGLIEAFDVFLTRMYANYYALISYRFLEGMEEAMSDVGIMLGSQLLTEAGHICAFYTFGGIMQSAEWKALVHPMLKRREDWVHGIVAVVNALGWGQWEIMDLVPHKRLLLRVTGGYEANCYLQKYKRSEYPISFLAKGGTAGIMNLIYNADLTKKTIIDDIFYKGICSSPNLFSSKQIKCRGMGDRYDLFEVTKAN